MDISVIQNNLGMWICAAFMIAIILIQAVLYLKLSRKEATTLGLPAEQQKEAMRSAAVTAVGPALALSIMLITLMTTLGGPTAWMRMNDVGPAKLLLRRLGPGHRRGRLAGGRHGHHRPGRQVDQDAQ